MDDSRIRAIVAELDAEIASLQERRRHLVAAMGETGSLPGRSQTATVAPMAQPATMHRPSKPAKSDAAKRLKAERWSLRKLEEALAKDFPDVAVTNVQLSRIFRGVYPMPVDLRAAIHKITGVWV